ncbi:hypothetical protein JP74_21835 [Devosia sp. 17-2-E-8]|nr:hypothetical protein JP74_21835 [Devosia sp. 17-2-E-8]
MSGFNQEQLNQLRQVMREELADAGLRLDGPDHQDAAREDFRFLRRLRRGVDGVASKIGLMIILALASGVVWVFQLGLQLWKGQ